MLHLISNVSIKTGFPSLRGSSSISSREQFTFSSLTQVKTYSRIFDLKYWTRLTLISLHIIRFSSSRIIKDQTSLGLISKLGIHQSLNQIICSVLWHNVSGMDSSSLAFSIMEQGL